MADESPRPRTPLPVDRIDAEPNDLFARLIANQLIEDAQPTFERARAGGWEAFGPAIKASENIGSFVSSPLLSGMVADVLTDPDTAAKLGGTILADIEEYVPADDWAELKATARFAHARQLSLPPHTVVRIARTGVTAGDLDREHTLQLLAWAQPEAAADDIVNTFVAVGGDYGKVIHSNERFKVTHDATHTKLLNILYSAGRITRRATAGRSKYSVKVL